MNFEDVMLLAPFLISISVALLIFNVEDIHGENVANGVLKDKPKR